MSALQEISGDVPLRFGDKLRYIAVNAWRNMSWGGAAWRAYAASNDVVSRSIGQSPSRLLTEDFLTATLPRLLPGRQLEVLEIGCGSGSMVRRLSSLGLAGRYTGIDIGNKFTANREPVPGFTVGFRQIDAHLYEPPVPIDFMISVSALEHIPNDAELLARLAAYMTPTGVQVHVVPAAAGLWTYLWHGYRQYTPRALTERFGRDGVEIYGLGGLGTFLLHLIVITPEIVLGPFVRKRSPRLYCGLMAAALRLDRWLPVCPTAHVVIKRHASPTTRVT